MSPSLDQVHGFTTDNADHLEVFAENVLFESYDRDLGINPMGSGNEIAAAVLNPGRERISLSVIDYAHKIARFRGWRTGMTPRGRVARVGR